MSNKNFNEKSFTFFTINYIVGFGFLTTIISLVKLNIFGIIVLLTTGFITFAVSLVYSRLTNSFKEDYGGTYSYSKKLNNKLFSFFLGWNQYMQGPILASTAPLFLADAASFLTTDEKIIWIIRLVSILFFIVLVLISTFGLKLNKKIILISAIVKWVILALGMGISLYLSIIQNNFVSNITTNNQITTYTIFSTILAFMYAFGGFEDVSSMAKDVKFNNFRKILMISFAFIISFYFIFYIIMLGINNSNISNFSQIFSLVFMNTGIIIFVIGLIFNGVSSKISINISTARKIVALSDDGYIFGWLSKKNKNNEYKNAIWFNLIITIISLILFWVIPTFLNLNNFFESVISIGSIAFLLQYIFTFIIALILHFKKKIDKIPLWEIIVYILGSLFIFATLLFYIFPFILNEKWTINNTIVITSYFGFLSIGFIIYLIVFMNNKKKLNKNKIDK
ncbi:APC family permease [Malacoplasma iowae]|uniref:Putative glutamate/gamma-aminobutyrate antiporter n=1 Tax=Malacoplasma iowae DK-CPA TaxID=1394179 RepID=A0A084U4N7_MALIO|nr:APC family permease [Malacoplasma iowae]KFB07923.1 putative glutamate/gamma-aminobutyrate antiporter [Malacoplasma iowae DK-CPA]WPL40119.1 APC family permease [Malacoplasma iowae]WPL41336.1 APC family permease [Malacoplasma iowae]